MRTLFGLTLAALCFPAPAYACGGMFCDAVAPVDQAAERIIFSFDGEMMDTEVQITYEGQDDDFAWVVPVPEEPELYVSNDAFFTTLANATVPTFSLVQETTGGQLRLGCSSENSLSVQKAGDIDGEFGGVNVVSEQTVGPYETVVLQAADSDVLVQWLQDQGYSLPDDLATAMDPYIADGQYFVALKLSSDKDTGDLAPLGMRYAATAASIPIQLTSIAAVPDLPIEVFVLGAARAVPDNYLHVQVNEAAIDWYSGGTNYRAVVAKAADEAGGQAFATDFAGSPANLGILLYDESMVNPATLTTLTDPIQWLDAIVYSGLPGSSQLTALLVSFVPAPPGVDDATFLSCPDCYANQVSAPDFDPVEATAAFNTEILQVMAAQQARLDRSSVLTRLFTTMDPEEMTADPIFVLNRDLPQEVSPTHTATDHIHASLAGDTTSRSLELSDGRSYSFADPDAPSMDGVDSPAALVIEDLSASGEGSPVFDGTDDAKAAAQAFSSGCDSEGAGSVFAPLLLLAAGISRRRR